MEALTSGGIKVDHVILPDGEEYKSIEVLEEVGAPAWLEWGRARTHACCTQSCAA